MIIYVNFVSISHEGNVIVTMTKIPICKMLINVGEENEGGIQETRQSRNEHLGML